MNGVHDMGGQHGMGPVAYQKERTCLSRSVGGAGLRAHARDARLAQVESRRRSLCPRAHAASRLSAHELLRALVPQARRARRAYGFVTNEEMESGKAAPGSTPATPAFSLATSPVGSPAGFRSSRMPAFDHRSRCASASAPGISIPRVTRACHGTRAARPASSYAITASMFFQTPTRICRARNVSTSTPFVSPHGSCGERAPHRATRFISTCGMTTLSARSLLRRRARVRASAFAS